LDFSLVLGFGFYGFKGYDFVGFSLDVDQLVFLGSEFVWFFRIGIRSVFVGSDSVGFRWIGFGWFFFGSGFGFFVGLDVGFASLDLRFFKGSGCFVFRNWIVSFADTKM
jgi:hypothetical protein